MKDLKERFLIRVHGTKNDMMTRDRGAQPFNIKRRGKMFNSQIQRVSTILLIALGYVFFCTEAVLSFLLIESFVFKKTFSSDFLNLVSARWFVFFLLGLPFLVLYYKRQKFHEKLAYLDDATGLYNRRYILKELAREFARAMRFGRELSLLMIDVDGFKNINDTYGHLTGDQILKEVSLILKKSVRTGDIVGRYGGDEFIAILPETNLESAKNVVLRLWMSIIEHDFKVKKKNIRVSLSIGTASLRNLENCTDIFSLIDKADQAMLNEKYRDMKRLAVA